MTDFEAMKINSKQKNIERVANAIEHLEAIKNELTDKSINFKEHLTHVNVKTKNGTLIYYQTGTIILKGKKIPKNKFWELINEIAEE